MRKQDLIQRVRALAGAPSKVAGLALATVLAGCGGGGSGTNNTCHFISVATGLIGQTSYTVGTPNAGGASITAAGVAAPVGSGTVDPGGGVFYVADTGNNRVLGYAGVPSGINTPVASFALGQPNLNSNAPGTSASAFAGPTKAQMTADGTTLVVTDSKNNRVLLFNPMPTNSSAVPTVVIGQGSFTTNTSSFGCTNGATACATSLNNPTGAMIAGGKLIIADKSNNRVLIYNTIPTAPGAAADVVVGQPDFATTTPNQAFDPVAQKVILQGPQDVWTDGFEMYVADTLNNRVLVWSTIPQSNYTTANYVVGQLLFNNNSPGLSSQVMNGPTSVFYDGAHLYVADTNNNRVLQYPPVSTKGPVASGVYGQEDFTHGANNDPDQNSIAGDQQNSVTVLGPFQQTMYGPQGVFVYAGNLFVDDTNNNRIEIYPVASSVDGSDETFCQF